MKVVNRKEFLLLPAGVIYAKGVPWAFEQLSVKGDSLEAHGVNDWTYLNPVWVDANDSGEASERLDVMLDAGASFPMETAFGRDGCFDSDAVFMVFERADLIVLRGFMDKAIEVTT